MSSKSEFLQIRVTPRQKALVRRAAAAAGQDISTYVLARALPQARVRFEALLERLKRAEEHSYVLAELNDCLTGLGTEELREAVAVGDVTRLAPFLQNYVAAMVELACDRRAVPQPEWVREVEPLAVPWFATPLKSLRLHLLRASPVPFRRRNLFVDASLGARV